MVIICPNSYDKLTKVKLSQVEIGSNIAQNHPYLVISALNCHALTICAIFTLHRYSAIETAPLCEMLEQSDNYSWRYYISKNWEIQKVLSRMQFWC